MDTETPTPRPNTVTVRRNPPRRARATPKITPFPTDEILSAESLPDNPTTSLPEGNETLKVFLRIRPLASPNQAPHVRAKSVWPQNPIKKNNVARGGAKISKKKSPTECISVNDSHSVTLSTPLEMQESKRIKSETYGGFSHVFSPYSSQLEVYERMVKPMVDEFLRGRSGMLAALGPSGSGKTHTVFGSPRDPGMVSLALRHIFKDTEPKGKQASRSFHISIFEIYTERGKAEKLIDLLPDGGELSMQQSSIKGLQEVLISNAEQAESLIAQAVLKRATAMTNSNSQSSRSQCIINIRDVPPKCKGAVTPTSNSAILTIIDLAGAEREKRTGNQGTRLLESNFINNTLMVFGLCLRSLLEHQKNPKKPLQKHFQNSMLTRYLRDYLEGKKRMTLILTAKPGEEDYLDTSYLLRQASPYMQIKFNEVDPSNMASKKRHYHASSAMDFAKPSPSLEHLKRMKLVISEHTLQNDEQGVEERSSSKEDASTVCKADASSLVSFKSEYDSQPQSERSHIIMRNFAKVLWNVLKEYNSKLKVAEMEIQSLNESIGYEKKKYLALEAELNEVKACCTCCKAKKVEQDTECLLKFDANKSSNVKETFNTQKLIHPRLEQSVEEPTLSTSCTLSDSEKLDREVRASMSIPGVGKIPSESSDPRPELSVEEPTLGTSCTQFDFDASDREVWASSSESGHPIAVEVEAVSKISNEAFNAQKSAGARLDPSESKPTLNTTCAQLDSEKSDREVRASSSEPHRNALDAEVASEIPSEVFVSSSLTKDGVQEPPSPQDVSSTKARNLVGDQHGEIRVNNCKPPRLKRTLMPKSSILLREFTVEPVDETEELKGIRRTSKLAADNQQRSKGSLSLLRLLQG